MPGGFSGPYLPGFRERASSEKRATAVVADSAATVHIACEHSPMEVKPIARDGPRPMRVLFTVRSPAALRELHRARQGQEHAGEQGPRGRDEVPDLG